MTSADVLTAILQLAQASLEKAEEELAGAHPEQVNFQAVERHVINARAKVLMAVEKVAETQPDPGAELRGSFSGLVW